MRFAVTVTFSNRHVVRETVKYYACGQSLPSSVFKDALDDDAFALDPTRDGDTWAEL